MLYSTTTTPVMLNPSVARPEVIEMTLDISTLRHLPVAEKLRIVTELWDDIAASNEAIVLPPDQSREASRRSAELIANPSIAIDELELWRRVDG